MAHHPKAFIHSTPPANRPNKYFQIAAEIREGILKGKHSGRLPTIAQLADQYGVTLVTMQKVFRLLKNDGYIDAAPGRGTFVSRIKRKRTHLLGAVVNGEGFLARRACGGLQSESSRQKEGLIISPIHHGKEEALDHLRQMTESQKVDGVVILPGDWDSAEAMMEYLQSQELPHVLISYIKLPRTPECSTITNNDQESSANLMRHLLRRGNRRIVFAHSQPGLGALTDEGSHMAVRYRHYERMMTEAGLKVVPPVVVLDKHCDNPKSRKATAETLRKADGIFCDDDGAAMRILRICLMEGIRVPADLSVASFDNTEASQFMGVTSIEQHFERIGSRAVQLLLQEIEARLPAPLHEEVKAELIIRASSNIKRGG